MFRVILLLVFVVCAAGLSLLVIYTGQPDLVFRPLGEQVSYDTPQGRLTVVFDPRGRVIYRRLREIVEPPEQGGRGEDAAPGKPVVRVTKKGDRTIKEIETGDYIERIVYDKNGIEIFRKRLPKVAAGVKDERDGAAGNDTMAVAPGNDSEPGGDDSSTVSPVRDSDPFAPENMVFTKGHDRPDGKRVEWYTTRDGAYRVKIIRYRGAVIHRQKFPIHRRSMSSAGRGKGEGDRQSPAAGKSSASGKTVNSRIAPAPPGETFHRISLTARGRGRNKVYVIWYESAHYKRKVVKKGRDVVSAFNYPKPGARRKSGNEHVVGSGRGVNSGSGETATGTRTGGGHAPGADTGSRSVDRSGRQAGGGSAPGGKGGRTSSVAAASGGKGKEPTTRPPARPAALPGSTGGSAPVGVGRHGAGTGDGDLFATRNMTLLERKRSGHEKVVEWYLTRDGAYKVKVVRVRGHIKKKLKFRLKKKPASPAIPGTGRDGVKSRGSSPSGTGRIPGKATPTSNRSAGGAGRKSSVSANRPPGGGDRANSEKSGGKNTAGSGVAASKPGGSGPTPGAGGASVSGPGSAVSRDESAPGDKTGSGASGGGERTGSTGKSGGTGEEAPVAVPGGTGSTDGAAAHPASAARAVTSPAVPPAGQGAAVSVRWTETSSATFKCIVDSSGNVIFRQRFPK